MNNLKLIVGPKGSGKSKRAEQILETNSSRPLYIATLPELTNFSFRIESHKARRTAKWECFETWGDIDQRFRSLEALMSKKDGILLDGLSAMFWGMVVEQRSNLNQLKIVHRKLRFELAKFDGCELVIVDCNQPFPDLGKDFWFNSFIEFVHNDYCDKF